MTIEGLAQRPGPWGRGSRYRYHCTVNIIWEPPDPLGLLPEEGTLEQNLEDIRISQGEKGQNKHLPGREHSTYNGLEIIDASGGHCYYCCCFKFIYS